jgi:PAS domain S-box-containing protein
MSKEKDCQESDADGTRKRETATQAASERADRLADLITLSYEPMLAWQLEGPIEFWNTGAERLYGFGPGEAVGHSSHTLLRTEFPVEFAELRSELVNCRGWSGELQHTCKDGRRVTVASRMQLLSDGTVLEVNRDVTQSKAFESQQATLLRQLGESEQKLRWLASIVESSDDAIISKSLDGIITSWNWGAERIFGYTANEVIGQPITIVIPQDRLDEERIILTRIRRGERIEHFETSRQRKDGSMIVVSVTISPIMNSEGKIVGASKSARDISKQKQSQDQIATLAREAEHRSKNLLATVLATIQLSSADTAENLKQAIEGRIRALANVHSLFVESRWIGAELSTVVRQELAPYCTNDGKRVRIAGPELLMEPNTAQAIAVILHELATNAAKYGSLSVPHGEIELKWQHDADGRLTVEWKEVGGPPVQTPMRKGFGTRVIGSMVDQLNGTARFDWNRDGFGCEIVLKM